VAVGLAISFFFWQRDLRANTVACIVVDAGAWSSCRRLQALGRPSTLDL